MKQKYFSYVLLFRFYFHIDASTKGKQVISTKAFHDLARYFFVNNPVLGGTIVLKGNAPMKQTKSFEIIMGAYT